MNWIREYVNRWEIQNTHQHPKAKTLMNTKYSTTITKWNCAISHFERNTRELKGEEKKNTKQRILFTYWLCEKIDKKEKQAIKRKKHRKKEAIHRNSQHSDKIILNLKTSTTFAMELCIHANVAPQQKHTWDRNKWRQQRNNRMHKHTHTHNEWEKNTIKQMSSAVRSLIWLHWNETKCLEFSQLNIYYIYICANICIKWILIMAMYLSGCVNVLKHICD